MAAELYAIFQADNGARLTELITAGALTLDSIDDDYILKSVKKGKINIIDALLNAGMYPNKEVFLDEDGDESTYLVLYSVAFVQPEILLRLLNAGGDANITDDTGTRALTKLGLMLQRKTGETDEQFQARMVKVKRMITMLLEHDADPDYYDDDLMFPPLVLASRYGHLDVVRQIVTAVHHVPMNQAINIADHTGETALISAARNGHIDIVRYLLEQGADKAIENDAGKTAYDVATNEDIKRLVALESPLIRAIKEEKTAEAIALIDGGADVNETDANQTTPLMWAAMKGNIDVIRKLLEKAVDVDAKNKWGSTPLYCAITTDVPAKMIEIMNLILEKNPNVNAVNSTGQPLLSVAIANEKFDAVRLLLDRGANLNVQDSGGLTPLMMAISTGQVVNATSILTKEQNLDLQDKNGYTALMWAADKGLTSIVRQLVEKGANKTIKNKEGETAYDIATNDEIKVYLGGVPSASYSGKTKSDIDYLEVFLGKTDAVTSEEAAMDAIKNMTVCPVCNAIDSRGPGCMYMFHVCKKKDRHEELYQKYKGADGLIWWCVYCGRICKGHSHYQLHLVNDTIRPDVFPAGSPFALSCDNSDPRDINGYVREVRLENGEIRRDRILPAVTNNGGNIREKLMRIARMVDYMFELQHFKGEISAREARKELIEEMWNAPMFRMRFDPLKFKKWKTDISVFRDDTAAAAAEVIPEAVPAPGDIEDPIIHDEPEVESSLLDEPPIIEFKHKNKDGVMFNHVHADDDKRFIGKLSLVSFMRTMGEKLGKCFDDDCGGWLWPQEIAKAFEDPRLAVTDEDRAALAAYKERFNSAKAPRVGGAEKWKFNHFTEMDDAMCYLPPKEKKAGNRTRKNKIKRAKKTRRN